MKKVLSAAVFMSLVLAINTSKAEDDGRIMVQMPEMMQQHMLANMRGHLDTLNEIVTDMAMGKLDKAADIAEQNLGMSSLDEHGASHLAQFMPEGMREAGTNMHKAASRFAMKLQEGEISPALNALSEVTAACVACHSGFRIR